MNYKTVNTQSEKRCYYKKNRIYIYIYVDQYAFILKKAKIQ